MKDFNLGERLALEWVQQQLEDLLDKKDITDKEVKIVSERICRRIDKIWSEQ